MKKSLLSLFLLGLLLLISSMTKAEHPPLDNAIVERLSEMEDGKLHMVFEAREGVWGNGSNISMHLGASEPDFSSWRPGRELESGPVRTLLTVRDGEVTHIKTRVGGYSRLRGDVVDLGEVDSKEAAAALMGLVRSRRGDVAEDAIGAAVLAAGVELWPRLLPIARDRELDGEVREAALFWLAQFDDDRVVDLFEEILRN